MSRGGRIRRVEPTSTTNLSGTWDLNEISDYISENKWPRGPEAPTSLTATASNEQLSLSWTAPATTHGTITNYLVEYAPSGGSATYVLTGSTSTSYTLTGLTNGTEYTVRVAAVNFTAGAYSQAATGTPSSAPPLALLSGNYTGSGTQADPYRGYTSGSSLFTANVAGTIYWSIRGRNTSGDFDAQFWLTVNGVTVYGRTAGGDLIASGSRGVPSNATIGWVSANLAAAPAPPPWGISNPGFTIYFIPS
jgi:hypothetical protein